MQRRSKATVAVGMPIARLLPRRHIEIALAYLAGYVLLDWLSYVHPFASFGITPWNPPTGLSFALILLFGAEFAPWLFIAPVLADALVRGFALPVAAEVSAALIIGGGYAAGTMLLLSPRLQLDATLASRQSLLLLIAVAVASTAVVAAGYVGMLVAFGVLSPADFGRAALRFWVGDVIGITVFTPFLLVLMTRRRLLQPSWEALGLLVLVLMALWVVFGLADALRFQLFYLFFLPVIWTAVRFGLEGVTAGLILTQVGLITAIHFAEQGAAADVTAYQALMVVLSFTGLAVGVLVSEQQRTQQQLRINQEALSRALRLSTMGEFAAALAHEINQPLTAVANYARLAKNAADPAAASEASDRVISQVERVAEVVRRLRNFIRLGRSETAPIAVAQLVNEAVTYCRAELDRSGVHMQLRVARDLPPVSVDALQIEQVIINLVRNSAEALTDAGRYDGRVAIEADREGAAAVVIRVRDNGPGLDPDVAERAIAPFTTTKQEGLGLGLSLARSIIEAHGGRLAIESAATGAVVSFTLRAATPLGEAT
jgi:two-component system, LuxR family, sensor kinase FixL